jgi:hypothetical protein
VGRGGRAAELHRSPVSKGRVLVRCFTFLGQRALDGAGGSRVDPGSGRKMKEIVDFLPDPESIRHPPGSVQGPRSKRDSFGRL